MEELTYFLPRYVLDSNLSTFMASCSSLSLTEKSKQSVSSVHKTNKLASLRKVADFLSIGETKSWQVYNTVNIVITHSSCDHSTLGYMYIIINLVAIIILSL